MTRTRREPAPATGTGPQKITAAKQVASVAQCRGEDDDPALFDRTLTPTEYLRGPGPRPATTGPEDADAPPWWWAEAERVVLALVDAGHQVSADDLRQKYPAEPSASGAAIGALFARLARQGRIREVGMVKSRRPEARHRRIILWGAP